MRLPVWKKIISYLYAIPMETVHSEHSGHLTVVLRNGRFQLCTDNAIYSYEDRYDNYRLALGMIDRELFSPSSVLILGFGLGSVAILLEKYGYGDLSITAVDIDEEVFYLAGRYAMPRIHSRVESIVADGMQYIRQTDRKWDLIISDIFIDDRIPPAFRGMDYLRHLAASMNEGGLLLYNTLAFNEKDRAESRKFFQEVFVRVFPEAALLPVALNFILANDGSLLKRNE